MSRVSIVVPVYHNATSLPDLVERFQMLAARFPSDTFEFVFIDDGSRDTSWQVLCSLAEHDPRICPARLSRNFGSNAAILAGLSRAQGDVVAAISADLQDPPELIAEMLELWRSGRRVVLAARKGRDDSFVESAISNTFYAIFRRFAISAMPRYGFDFFLIDRRVCDLIVSIQENNAYLMGLILWLGFDPALVHYQRAKRATGYGRSMWTFAKKIKYFVDSFVAFSYLPVRLMSAIGVSLALVGLAYAVLVVVLRLASGMPVEGWTSLMVVLLVVSGVQMTMIGVLGEYVWRNLDEARRRPRFVVSDAVRRPQGTASLANVTDVDTPGASGSLQPPQA